LLDGAGRVALADFGVSRWINRATGESQNDGRAKTFVGTPCWMAPEVKRGGGVMPTAAAAPLKEARPEHMISTFRVPHFVLFLFGFSVFFFVLAVSCRR
jgi:serine/threonine protein kinase